MIDERESDFYANKNMNYALWKHYGGFLSIDLECFWNIILPGTEYKQEMSLVVKYRRVFPSYGFGCMAGWLAGREEHHITKEIPLIPHHVHIS